MEANNLISGKELIRLKQDVGNFNKTINKPASPKTEVMGKDEFLKLLVTQLTKQDPMNPMKNTEFIAQMAQFSALEQMHNVSKSVDSLSLNMYRMEAQNLIGKTVRYQLGENFDVQEGVVNTVKYDREGNPTLLVNGTGIGVNDVLSVVNKTAHPRAVKAYNYNGSVK